MPRKQKRDSANQPALPSIPKELIDQFVKGPMTAEALQLASAALGKALIERAPGAELGHHPGYLNGAKRPQNTCNQRNGRSVDSPRRPELARDRDGTFGPILSPKHERRFTGFAEKSIAMCARRGMTVHEIQGFLAEQYGTEVSPEFISSVTDAVMDEVGPWQTGPLEPMYPVVLFGASPVKVRDEGLVRNEAVYLALYVLPDGTRDILRLVVGNTEGVKFWKGLWRPENAWRTGHPDCRDRRTARHVRSAGRGVSGDDAADLHRASFAQLAGICERERTRPAGRCDPANLCSPERRACRSRPAMPCRVIRCGNTTTRHIAYWT